MTERPGKNVSTTIVTQVGVEMLNHALHLEEDPIRISSFVSGLCDSCHSKTSCD